MSPETCLGSIHSIYLFQGSLYLLKKSKTDSEVTISPASSMSHNLWG